MKERVTVLLAGHCPPTVVDEYQSWSYISATLELIQSWHPNAQFRLVSGLTSVGALKHGYNKARHLGWYLVGVASEVVNSGEYELFEVDSAVIVGETWGDESDRFLSFCIPDQGPVYFVNVAGGKQASREQQQARELGAVVLTCELERN